MARNVVSVKGGVVHLPASFSESGDCRPLCPSGSAESVFVRSSEKATCKTCMRLLKSRKAPVAIPAEIPKNWFYMAKHANTKSARAWWRKKCGMPEEN